ERAARTVYQKRVFDSIWRNPHRLVLIFGHHSRLTGVRPIQQKRCSRLFNEDHRFGKSAPVEARIELKATIDAFKDEPLESEWTLPAGIIHVEQTRFTVQFVFEGGVEHRQTDLNFELALARFQTGRQGLCQGI